MNIEDIRPNLYLENLSPGEVTKVLYVAPAGTDAVRVVYDTPSLGVRDRQVFRSDAAGMDDNVVSQNYDLSALVARGLQMRGDA